MQNKVPSVIWLKNITFFAVNFKNKYYMIQASYLNNLNSILGYELVSHRVFVPDSFALNEYLE